MIEQQPASPGCTDSVGESEPPSEELTSAQESEEEEMASAVCSDPGAPLWLPMPGWSSAAGEGSLAEPEGRRSVAHSVVAPAIVGMHHKIADSAAEEGLDESADDAEWGLYSGDVDSEVAPGQRAERATWLRETRAALQEAGYPASDVLGEGTCGTVFR